MMPSSKTKSSRNNPGGGWRLDLSSKPLTDVPYGAVAIAGFATLLLVRGARGLAGAGVLLVDVQQHGEDLAGGRRSRVGTESAALVRRNDDVARVRERRQDGVPGLVRAAQALLSGAGLARHLDGEVGEYGIRRAARAARGLVQAVEDRRAVLRLDVELAPRRRVELLDCRAVGVLGPVCQVRLDDVAAVRD